MSQMVDYPLHLGITEAGTPTTGMIKSAVGRNRVRRRVYEAIRMNLPYFKDNKDCIFVIYSKDVKEMEFDSLLKMIRDLLTQSQTQ
jgi:ribonuclease P protein component